MLNKWIKSIDHTKLVQKVNSSILRLPIKSESYSETKVRNHLKKFHQTFKHEKFAGCCKCSQKLKNLNKQYYQSSSAASSTESSSSSTNCSRYWERRRDSVDGILRSYLNILMCTQYNDCTAVVAASWIY